MERHLFPPMRRGPPSGHTLWEMLLALGLLAVIAAIVAPSIGFVRAAADESVVARTSRTLAGALTQARLFALEHGTPVDLLLDPTTGRVWIVSRTLDEQRITASGQLELPPGVTLLADGEGARVRFTFDASGTGTAGGVTVRGPGGEQRVSVDPWSGAIDVQSR